MCIALAVCAAFAAGAGAQVTNRAQVGVSGRNDTKGYSPSLYIVFASPSAYRSGCCTDTDSGEWLGPKYQASGNPSLSGDSKIAWAGVFDRRPKSATAAANAALVQKWPQVSQKPMSVPHVVRGTTVGTIPGVAVLTRSPAEPAQHEAALGFPLCRGFYVATEFDLLAPFTDSTGGVAGQYMVNGTLASTWNRQQADAAVAGVRLEGYLPAASLTARRKGNAVVGVLRDCAHHPMPGVRVRIGAASATTGPDGSFVVRRKCARGRCPSVVKVSAGGATVRARVR